VADPPYPEAPTDHWGRTLAVNLIGPMLAIQHALPLMERRGGGAVVNVSSVAGLGYIVPQRSVAYAAAKAGLIRLSVVLGSLAGRCGVRVNCVVPNWILTEAVRSYLEGLTPEERAAVPGLREPVTTPEEIAGAIAHLVRDDALAGRVMICWHHEPWTLVAAGDEGYAGFEEVSG
jgi:NAD(P)-dependent dehydrogenase (short-subunit alcohol dehydrogenase family)